MEIARASDDSVFFQLISRKLIYEIYVDIIYPHK